MEDFSLLMDDWVQNQYDFDHYDDLNLIGPGNAPYVSVKAEPQAFENPIDVLEVIEDSIPDNLRGNFTFFKIILFYISVVFVQMELHLSE